MKSCCKQDVLFLDMLADRLPTSQPCAILPSTSNAIFKLAYRSSLYQQEGWTGMGCDSYGEQAGFWLNAGKADQATFLPCC
jgi:hypothetical protein